MKFQFKKEIKLEEDRLTIEISVNKRTYSAEPKVIFRENIMDSIPEHLREKVKLVSSPKKPISNLDREKYTNFGKWEFLVIKQEEKKVTTRKRRQTKNQKQPQPKSEG